MNECEIKDDARISALVKRTGKVHIFLFRHSQIPSEWLFESPGLAGVGKSYSTVCEFCHQMDWKTKKGTYR